MRILVVDDEAALRLLLQRELEDRGHAVTVAPHPSEAVRALEREPFDLVLTDIRMPGMTGLQLTGEVRRRWPQTDVILMTGFASLESAAEGLRLGAFDYLMKPFTRLELALRSIARLEERRSLRAEAERLKLELVHRDRLAAIGRLAAGVAHEINNPACFVLANLGLMRESLAGDTLPTKELPELREMLVESVQGLERISAIVRSLTGFARLRGQEQERLRLEELVGEAVDIAEEELLGTTAIELELGDTPPVAARRGELLQLVVNLLLTARGDPGMPVERRVTLSTATTDTHGVALEMRDALVGLGSLGPEPALGLAICEEIATRHGGTLTISILERERVYTLTLPSDGTEEPRRARRPTPSARVLVVDDEPLVLSACRRMLGSDHEVVTVPGGAECLALLERDSNFDAILCDLIMPRVDGIRVYRTLQQNAPEHLSRLIFITGGANVSRARRFLDDVRPRLIEKPFTAQQILEQVRAVAQTQD